MLKKSCFLTIIFVVILLCSGCASREIKYHANLGYDLTNIKHNDISFNVYHSNTKDHRWELIKSFKCIPVQGYFNDIVLNHMKNQVTVKLSENVYQESDDGKSASYDLKEKESFEYAIDGYNGSGVGCKYFEIEDKEGEQLLRLYPISNTGTVSFLENVSLNQPYDMDGKTENIDNILITIVMK